MSWFRRREPRDDASPVARMPHDDPSLSDEELIAQRVQQFEEYTSHTNVVTGPASEGPWCIFCQTITGHEPGPFEMCDDCRADLDFLDLGRYSCPCCGHVTLNHRGAYEICSECWWEDDGQDDHDAEVVRHGPNGGRSLAEARLDYVRRGGVPQPHRPPGGPT